MSHEKLVGKILWTDLTVPDAAQVRDFYSAVVGWTFAPVSMGDYDDFNMNAPADGSTVAGICFAQGVNAKVPAQWLIYIQVNDINQSIARCRELGGQVVDGPREMGPGVYFCVIQDPAGAVAALIGPSLV